MHNAFSLAGSRCQTLPDPTLTAEIRAQTGSDSETASILRCIERFSGDGSIRYYEITPQPARRTYHSAPSLAWTVTAVR